MITQNKEIKEIIDLKKIPVQGSQVIGISNLGTLPEISAGDVYGSRGEFAGILFENGSMAIFRDRLGARSIFYAVAGDRVAVSTDLGWLARNVKTEPDWAHIRSDYMQFQLPFSDETFFAGIKRVMPGEIVWVDREMHIKKEKYWEPKFGNEVFHPGDLLELLKDAVQYRLALIGEQKFTSYLSGGMDSSTITLLAKPKECFSGFYEEEGYSEMDFIQAVISVDGLPERYLPVQISQDSFQKQMEKLPEIIPDPCAGLGVIAQVLVAQEAAREGYTYAFTGEGGDEIFLGYNWNTIVFSLANAARSLLRDRYMVRYEPMVEKVLRDAFPTFTGGLLSRGDDILYATQKVLSAWDHDQSVENNILQINLTVGLPAILLVDELVGKFTGVEPVSPMMDHKIVEYVCSIRSEERAPIPKHMLREALKGILPEKIRTRYDKMGFPVPFQKWDWSVLKPVMASLAQRNVLDFDPARQTMMTRDTWALYCIETWCQYYFGEGIG